MAKKKINKKPVKKVKSIKKVKPRKKALKLNTKGSKITFSTSAISIRQPISASILKIREEKVMDLKRKKEKLFIRYTFHIESLEVDEKNILKEISFEYKGVKIIPKSLKDSISSQSYSVIGTHIVPVGSNHPILLKDYTSIKRKEIITYLSSQLRKDYIKGMRDVINKELLSENKKIEKLPWKY
tara:strand:- start:1067 stop:1618 length:552 start_codon:yes stop_codon:yes gene_type:complete